MPYSWSDKLRESLVSSRFLISSRRRGTGGGDGVGMSSVTSFDQVVGRLRPVRGPTYNLSVSPVTTDRDRLSVHCTSTFLRGSFK